ncbi:MAG: LysR family transcriptional regulator [Rhizobiaceae bacterium]
MRLEWIDDILAVLDQGSLARAAEKRYLTQSAFTRRVRMIEENIGTVLFDRSRKPVTLMPGVGEMEPELREMSARLRQLKLGLKTASSINTSSMTIACQHALTATLSSRIVGVLSAYQKTVRVRSGNRDECFMQLLSGDVDLSVMYELPGEQTPAVSTAFEAVLLGMDALIPVCIPSIQEMTIRAEIPIISYPSDVFLGQLFDRIITPQLPDGITISRKAETSLTLAMLKFVLDGYGIAWLPESLVTDHLSSGQLIKLGRNFPQQTLEIKMFRLSGDQNNQQAAIWKQIGEHMREA